MCKGFVSDFKSFIMRGNVVDMAVGIVIGAAFSSIVTSLVSNVIMPPIGLLLGKVDFSNLYLLLQSGSTPGPYPSLEAARKVGAVTLNYGLFINAMVSFLIIAFVIFLLIRAINHLYQKPAAAATTKVCPFCAVEIPLAAKRCPHCTSNLES